MANRNINTGPTTQLSRREIESILVLLKIFGNRAKLTFAKGGYIIRIKPIAMRIFVAPLLKEFIFIGKLGIK